MATTVGKQTRAQCSHEHVLVIAGLAGAGVGYARTQRCLRRRHVPRRHGVRVRAAAFFFPHWSPGGLAVTVPFLVRRPPMRIALVAGNEVADAAELSGLGAALRDAGQEVSEHVMGDAGPDADVRSALPGFAESLRSLWSRE